MGHTPYKSSSSVPRPHAGVRSSPTIHLQPRIPSRQPASNRAWLTLRKVGESCMHATALLSPPKIAAFATPCHATLLSDRCLSLILPAKCSTSSCTPWLLVSNAPKSNRALHCRQSVRDIGHRLRDDVISELAAHVTDAPTLAALRLSTRQLTMPPLQSSRRRRKRCKRVPRGQRR